MTDSEAEERAKALAQLLADILDCETMVWEALKAGDVAAYDTALAPDFQGVYPDGFVPRAVQMEALAQGPLVREYALSDTRLRQIGADHALLSYRAAFRRVGQKHEEVMFVSSLWQRAGEGWINSFSQDTPEGAPVP